MDLICFSHLRWNFVFQRPQHLMIRCAEKFRVFFIEEPVFIHGESKLNMEAKGNNLFVVTPMLPFGLFSDSIAYKQQELLSKLFSEYKITDYIAWFYTPMALPLSETLPEPQLIIYDCMDELSNFKFAPPEMHEREKQLLKKSDLVFTGGHSLYEAKKHLHHNIHSFPSSIDKEHFGRARKIKRQPLEQYYMKGPRIGFFGVIDERMDLNLIEAIALKQPTWNLIIIGPIAKIDPADLPRLSNIHYLGQKEYNNLPEYLGGWDVAILPFALNDSTKFISPTKTPEYLAGGIPVVSTAIRDVVETYEDSGLVSIGRNEDEFIEGIAKSLELKKSEVWIKAVDTFLKDISWDNTWEKMLYQVNKALVTKQSLIKKHSHV